MRYVLNRFDYPNKDENNIGAVDLLIVSRANSVLPPKHVPTVDRE